MYVNIDILSQLFMCLNEVETQFECGFTDLVRLIKGAVTRGNFFLQLVTQIWVKKILQAPVEL